MTKKKKKSKKVTEIDLQPPRRVWEGKHVVVFRAILGLAAGLVSWGYYVQLQRKPMEFWGPDGAKLLMHASEVSVMKLVPRDELPKGKEAINIYSFGGQRWAVVEIHDISFAGGLGIMRQTLMNSNSYAWSERADQCQPVWQYALQFAEPDVKVSQTLFLSLDCPRAMLLERPDLGSVSIRPSAKALRTFLEDQFKEQEKPEKAEKKAAEK
jgi:hypothetical protein